MSKTMAEVLEELWEQGNCAGLDGWIGLGRGVRDFDEEAVEIRRRDVATALEALSAAGFGLVADAKAEALEEAADHLARLEYVRPDHPNRAAYEKILAVRRGNTDAWLKARAGLIRAAS